MNSAIISIEFILVQSISMKLDKFRYCLAKSSELIVTGEGKA